MSFQNHLHRLRPIDPNVEPHFYVFFLQSAFTQLGIFEGAGNKTTIPNLSRSRLAGLEAPQPPLDEQQAIDAALSQVRHAIQAQDQSIVVASELKRSAMQTLFTRGLRGEAQKETEIGPVPESWEVRRMEEVARVFSSSRLTYGELLRRSDSTKDRDAVRVLGIKVKDMAQSDPEAPISKTELSRSMLKEEAEHRCIAPGAIVFPKNGAAVATNKKRIVATWCVLDPNVMALHAGEALEQDYLYQWMQTFDLSSIENAGPVPNFGKGAMSRVLMPVAPMDEQHELASILDAIDRKIALHRCKRAVLEELFKALLHKLMTGEVRVGEIELIRKFPKVSASQNT
jgi:type I restriction enzyme S subunit